MSSFLKDLAKEVSDRYQKPEDICFVLPSKRAAAFLKTELAKAYNTTFWAPTFLSLGEFVEEWADSRKEDNLILILELYESYLKVAGKDPEDLDSFLKWAPTLLNDFGEIDRYLIDPTGIFSYINDARALEYWNLDGEPLTTTQLNYLHFWKLLGKLYFQFNTDLKKKGKVYSGQQYKSVASNINVIIEKIKFEKIIFAGFNALSKSEEKIIFSLIKGGKAEIFWDSDKYYIDNQEQEAGLFMRRIKHKYPSIPFLWQPDHISKIGKEITIVGCNTDLAQAEFTGRLLESHYRTADNFKTAVVLNNENLLLPLLYNLPENVEAANVTMGYNLKLSPLASFINIWLDLWNNFRLHKESRIYYYKNVFRLIEHPYFVFSISGKRNLILKLKEALVKRNVIYVSKSDFKAVFDDAKIVDLLFDNSTDKSSEIICVFLQLFSVVKENVISSTLSEIEKSIHLEYLFSYTTVVRKFGKLIDHSTNLNAIKNRTFKKLINQLVNSESLSFFGEPLKGLQIMGMLETRLLDFDKVIILSVNEGVLPQGKVENSFIPFDIKREFNLPTHVEMDAVYANHFYRLIQRAKKIDLLYLSGKNDFGANHEKSRFIEQIEYEFPRVNSQIKIKVENYTPSPIIEKSKLCFSKNELLVEKIISRLESGISPSALNKFIACPLEFYYRYILGLGEVDEVEENVQHSTFGTCIHETLEELFTPLVNLPLTVKMINDLKPKVKSVLSTHFLQYLSVNDLKSGNNLLTFEVALRYVTNFLEQEIKTILLAQEAKVEYIILEQERPLELVIPIQFEGREVKVKLRGIADRIGKFGDTFQLIDYKTGNVSSTDLLVSNWDVLSHSSSKSKALQLLIYGYIYLSQNKNISNFTAGIYSFRNFKSGLLKLRSGKKEIPIEELLMHVPLVIESIVTNMLDSSLLIEHNEESKYCNYC